MSENKENALENKNVEIKGDQNKDCPICSHAGKDLATEIYFSNDREYDAVIKWFKEKFGKSFSQKEIKYHFVNHVDPYVNSFIVEKEKKINNLKERMANQDMSSSAFETIKSIVFDLITDAYAAKPSSLRTKEDRVIHEKISKQIATLVKSYTSTYEMQFKVMGFGKSEEEQKDIVRNYMVGMIKNIIDKFEDMPEARDRLKEIFNTAISADNME